MDADQPSLPLPGERWIVSERIIIIAGLFILPFHRLFVGGGWGGRNCSRTAGEHRQEKQYQKPEKNISATGKRGRKLNDKEHTDKCKQGVEWS